MKKKPIGTLMALTMLCASTQISFGQKGDETEEKAKTPNCVYAPISHGSELSNYCDEPSLDDWSLVFEDNFNGPSLDQSKWMSGYGWADYAGDALYREQNITFPAPGEVYLNIDTDDFYGKGISYKGPNEQIHLYGNVYAPNERTWSCTAGAIRSHRQFKYGKFEIRCHLPDGESYFPAFWLFAGPTYSEIDIFEFKGQYSKVTNNMHHNLESNMDENDHCGGKYNPLFQGKWSEAWHKYKCEWDQWKITFFVDDTPIRTVYRFTDAAMNPITNLNAYTNTYPFVLHNKAFPTRPMYLIAGMGTDDGEGMIVQPGAMKIDYIRVWSKNPELANLDVDNPNAVYMPDENHRYSPNTGGFTSEVEYLHEAESSNFADGQGGDFNGDGIDEFVSVSNLNGNIIIHSINDQSGKFRFQETGRYTGAAAGSDWAGVACGDVDNDGMDEIVAVRNSDAQLFVWDVNYTPGNQWIPENFQIVSKCTYSGANQYSDWRGIECGDFDADGTDEIALVRDLDQDIFFWEYNSTTNSIVGLATCSIFGSGSNFADLTAGDFNGDGRDEVAVVRNSNGGMYIVELNSSNQPYIRLAWTAPNAASNWTSITAGSYKDMGHDQIVLHRKMDNLVTMVDAVSSVVAVAHDYPCTIPQALGSGFFDEDCENFVIMNNLGEYELKSLPGYCTGKFGRGSEGPMKSTENASYADAMSIYPNPTNGLATMKFESALTGRFEVISLDGKLVQQGDFRDAHQIKIDLSDKSKGIYTVRVVLNGESISKKIIKH